MIDPLKSIQVSETLIRLLQDSIDNNTGFRDFELFELFDRVESDLDKHERYTKPPYNCKLIDYKHELNYPNVSIERLEENYNKIHKLIMLRY